MQIRTIPMYLLGRRSAILEIAGDPRWLLVGFLFVVSAGFAREYDGTDLSVNPGAVFRPLLASTGAALVLFHALRWFGVFPGYKRSADPVGDQAAPPHRSMPEFGFPAFLALFWMTAPLAWLYAVPAERFLDPLQTTAANLWFLASVAAWRVALMIRVAVVVGGCGAAAAACLVLLLVDIPVLVATQFKVMFGVAGAMAGIRTWISPSDVFLHDVTLFVSGTVCWTFPVLVVVTGNFVAGSRPWTPAVLPAPRPGRTGPVFAVAGGFVLAGVVLSAIFQPEQRRRTAVERLYREDKFAEMIAELSAHPHDDYPPHWEPPPRNDAANSGRLCNVVAATAEQPCAEWVRSLYERRFREFLPLSADDPHMLLWRAEARDIARALRALPDRAGVVNEFRAVLENRVRGGVYGFDLGELKKLVESGLLDDAAAARLAPDKWGPQGAIERRPEMKRPEFPSPDPPSRD